MARESFQFYGLIWDVILKIHLIYNEKIKVKVYANQEKYFSANVIS